MRRVLLCNDRSLRVIRLPGDGGVFSFIDCESADDARRYLHDYAHDPSSLAQMRTILAEDAYGLDVWRLDDSEVFDELASRISMNRLAIAEELDEPLPPEPQEPDSSSAAPPPQLPRSKQLTYIELKVVWDANGQPVKNVRLVVTAPDGNQTYQTTSAEGLVRLENLEPGKCDISCELKNPALDNVLAFVAMGEASAKASGAEDGNGQSSRPATLLIADVEKHKVKTGETLDALAKKAGMSWKDLAKFNWKTDLPDEINKRLRNDVGCTKKTKDGLNYVFDDSDKPGIVFIPRRWEQTGLATGGRHVVRVRTLKRFFVRLENDLGLRIPEVEYEAVLADGREVKGQLGIGGVDAIDDPPDGEVGIRFPDLDDIEAKSIAASARKSFDDRDPREIHRLFRYIKDTVKRAIAAYDKYFNDYRGKGFKNDIEEEFSSDEQAIGLFNAYLINTEKPESEEDESEPYDDSAIEPPEQENSNV